MRDRALYAGALLVSVGLFASAIWWVGSGAGEDRGLAEREAQVASLEAALASERAARREDLDRMASRLGRAAARQEREIEVWRDLVTTTAARCGLEIEP